MFGLIFSNTPKSFYFRLLIIFYVIGQKWCKVITLFNVLTFYTSSFCLGIIKHRSRRPTDSVYYYSALQCSLFYVCNEKIYLYFPHMLKNYKCKICDCSHHNIRFRFINFVVLMLEILRIDYAIFNILFIKTKKAILRKSVFIIQKLIHLWVAKILY